MFDLFADAGLGPIPLGSPGAGSLIAYPPETYQTPVLDFTKPTTVDIELVPAKVGLIPTFNFNEFIIEKLAGTQVTPAVIQAGSDAARTNFVAAISRPTTADVNAANPPCFTNALAGAANTVKRDVNAPVFFRITSPASGTGGFELKAKWCVTVQWMGVDVP